MKRRCHTPQNLIEVLEQRELLSITQVPKVAPSAAPNALPWPPVTVEIVTGPILLHRVPMAGMPVWGPVVPGRPLASAGALNFSGGTLQDGGWSGKLDLTNNSLILDPGYGVPVTSGGQFTVSGLGASMTGVAIQDNGDLRMTSFRGMMAAGSNNVVLNPGLAGRIDGLDLNLPAAQWAAGTTATVSGTAMLNGNVSASDLNALAANWQNSNAG